MEFKKATKLQAKLRLALFGPSGSGKTFTALRLASGMGGNIAVIDTERGSASKYAGRFEFDVLELPAHKVATYCNAISAASAAGYGILVIDSLTHGWHELLAEVGRLARTKYSGNTWSAWSEGTPLQRQLVDAILMYPGHIIATMRTKTEWTTEKNSKGKVVPVRVGMSPEQGKGIEYEFDLLMELTVDHIATVIKDRTGKYQDETIEMPGEDLGQQLAEWLQDGVAPEERPKKRQKPKKDQQRPADPPTVRKWLRTKAGWERGKRADMSDATRPEEGAIPNQDGRQRLAALMSKGLKSDDKMLRYSCNFYLWGYTSTGVAHAAEVDAALSWLELEPGAWEPNEDAAEELRRIHNAALEDAGQQRLPMDEAQQ